MDLVCINSLDEIETDINGGHYWNFPEFIWTFGNGLKGARLMLLKSNNWEVYFRARGTMAAMINWTGDTSREAVKEAFSTLYDSGFRLLSFNPSDKALPIPYYHTNVWYSYGSLIDSSESKDQRWQLRRALKALEFSELTEDSLAEALECIKTWRIESERRHGNVNISAQLAGQPFDKDNKEFAWVMGYGHYVYSTQQHLEIPNSRFFVGRNPIDNHVSCVVGGWVRDKYANCMIVKHDFSSKWNIQAIWTKWTEHVHKDLGCTQSDNGTTSDFIKQRLGMTKYSAVKHTKFRLSPESIENI